MLYLAFTFFLVGFLAVCVRLHLDGLANERREAAERTRAACRAWEREAAFRLMQDIEAQIMWGEGGRRPAPTAADRAAEARFLRDLRAATEREPPGHLVLNRERWAILTGAA